MRIGDCGTRIAIPVSNPHLRLMRLLEILPLVSAIAFR